MQHTGGRPITETKCDDPSCECNEQPLPPPGFQLEQQLYLLSRLRRGLEALSLLEQIIQDLSPSSESNDWLVADRLIVAARRLLQQKP